MPGQYKPVEVSPNLLRARSTIPLRDFHKLTDHRAIDAIVPLHPERVLIRVSLIDAKCRSPRPTFRVHFPVFSLAIFSLSFSLFSLSTCLGCRNISIFIGVREALRFLEWIRRHPSLDLPYSSSRYAARAFTPGTNAGVRWAE